MIAQSVLSGLAKVVAIGGLMAAGGGGIYLVTSTQDEPDQPRAVAEPTAPVELGTETSGTPEGTTTTPAPVETPVPTATATAFSPPPTEPMFIGGDVWVNAGGAAAEIQAVISGMVCASATAGQLPDGYGATFFVMSIPSDAERSGCGIPGAVVQFTVDGIAALQTVTWSAGEHPPVVLRIGPEFAQYFGQFTYAALPGMYTVEPLINGVVCGRQIDPARGNGEYGYHVVVLSQEAQSGCGQPGVVVTFRLMDLSGSTPSELVLDFPTAPWQPNSLVELPHAPVSSATPFAETPVSQQSSSRVESY